MEHIPDNFLVQDLLVDGDGRVQIYATTEQLQLLAKAKTWYESLSSSG